MKAGLKALAKADPALARAIDAVGTPTVRSRAAGFEGLFRIIIGQQVSVQSANAIWGRCVEVFPEMDPARVLTAEDDQLRACGLSRPKARYVRALAEAVTSRALDFDEIAQLSDDAAAEALTKVVGIGPWSAGIYLLFCEQRPDIWPVKDLALLVAYSEAAGLPERMPMAEFDAHALATFAPYRGLAAHLLWSYFGVCRGRDPV